MTKDNQSTECSICSCKFTDKEGGVSGSFGIIPVSFCMTCFGCALDMADQFNTGEEIEQAVLEEREACAQIAFNAKTYLEAAAAIRARGLGNLNKKAEKDTREPVLPGGGIGRHPDIPNNMPIANLEEKELVYPTKPEPTIDGWPLYSGLPQREWVGLTDEERANCSAEAYGRHFVLCELIEFKLKQKNG
jgi:hypothetical protein